MWINLPAKVTMKYECGEDSKDDLKLFADRYGWETWDSDWKKMAWSANKYLKLLKNQMKHGDG